MPNSLRMRATVPTALCAFLLATACGGGSSDNGIEKLSPDKALAKVKAALADVKTVHVAGTIGANGQTLTVDLRDKAGAGTGTLHLAGGTISLVRLNDTVYVKGDAKALQGFGASSAQAAVVAGKWIKSPASGTSGFASLGSLLDTKALFDNVTSPSGTVKAGKTTTVNGKKVYTLIDAESGGNGTLYVAQTGDPLPVKIDQPGSGGGSLTFDYGGSVDVSAPSGAVDLSQLSGG